MIGARVQAWSAWSPGLEDRAAWRAWCAHPAELALEGRPDAQFLPAMLRRRCSTLARMMLSAAFDCCESDKRSEVATVFSSRHGNINESIDLLDRLADDKPLSPTRFSHTVHNAQAGLFSIAANNRCPSSSISAQQDSFACGYLESMAFLQREPTRPVLLVVGDAPLEPRFGPIAEPIGSYAVALLLATGGDTLEFEVGSADESTHIGRWPDATEFLRWHLSDESELQLCNGRRRWTWRKTRAAAAA